MSDLSKNKVGVRVDCLRCGRMKQPWGRSVPYASVGAYCYHDSCSGWDEEPLPGSLFPGESEHEFGYPCGLNGVEILED